jgi:glycosyltransferase involved in cell wall biosynthesis
MVAAPRVLIVTRRFWPLASDSCYRVLNLAATWATCGWKPQVLTASWHSAWPEQVTVSEVPVNRLGPAPTTPFRARRYTRALGEWLGQRLSQFDLIYCDAPDEDAARIFSVAADRGQLPCVVRYAPDEPAAGLGSDTLASKTLAVCRKADAIVVPRPSAHRRLIQSGVPDEKIVGIHDHCLRPFVRSRESRSAARVALADINYELFLRAEDPLIICPACIQRSRGLELVVHALGPVLENHRGMRLWIVGDGPHRESFFEHARRIGLRHQILFPGSFEDMELVYQAADLCILPSPGDSLGWLLPAALASGLPLFACASQDSRRLLGPAATQLTYETGNTESLVARVESWLARDGTVESATRAAGQHWSARGSVEAAWRDLYGRLNRCHSRQISSQ